MNVCSKDAKKMVAYAQATGVPMAVPICWSHKVSPNWKTLFRITCTSRGISNSKGRGESASYFLKYLCIVMMPSPGSILTYIAVASEVTIFARGGKG